METRVLKLFAVFVLGAISYGIMEVLVRGFSHISMGFLGGASMIVIHFLNDRRREGMSFFLQILLSAFFITSAEFLSGEILNRMLHMNIWDYSDVPMNYDGQICLPFSLLWILLSVVGTATDDFLRWKMFREDKNFDYLKKITAAVK